MSVLRRIRASSCVAHQVGMSEVSKIGLYERMALTMLRRAAAAKHDDAREVFLDSALECIRSCMIWEDDKKE